MAQYLTLKELYDGIVELIDPVWMHRNSLEKKTVLNLIDDEMQNIVAETAVLEGEFTGSGDGSSQYLEINENLAIVRRVHYDYTSGSDWGDLLDEVTPLYQEGKVVAVGDPEKYWVQGMHRYNKQRIYFDKIPASGKTIRVLFYKWADVYDEGDTLEFRRLWATAIKYAVAATCIVRDPEKAKQYNHFMFKHQESMQKINKLQASELTGQLTGFHDV